jgi:hypothetical protein
VRTHSQNKDKPAAAARENACENKTQKPHATKFTSAKSTGGAHFLSQDELLANEETRRRRFLRAP